MVQSYTLFTSEVDVPDIAVGDIMEQLADILLCKNTVGIVACHYDHVECGVIAALQQVLPFPLIGCTTFYKSTSAAGDLFALTITVLTSDDVHFAQSFTNCTSGQASPEDTIRGTYQRAFEKYGVVPSLIISFISTNRPISGDAYLRILDGVSGNVPVFGAVDSGEDDSGANTYIIGDGNAFSDGIVMLLVIGDIDAKMYVNAPIDKRLLAFSATVTSAQGTLVKEINGQVAASYLKKNGIDVYDANETIMTSMPFYCHRPGSDAFICRLIKAVLDDGSIEFMAEIPEGTILRVGTVTADDILQESAGIMQTAVLENPQASLFLMASCVGRFITLGLDTTAEIDHAVKAIPSEKNYMACYAGGEMCPIEMDGTLVNRYHNNTFIVLALR